MKEFLEKLHKQVISEIERDRFGARCMTTKQVIVFVAKDFPDMFTIDHFDNMKILTMKIDGKDYNWETEAHTKMKELNSDLWEIVTESLLKLSRIAIGYKIDEYKRNDEIIKSIKDILYNKNTPTNNDESLYRPSLGID